MRDYTATPTNPTTFACHMLTKEASTPLPNNSLAADLAKSFNPLNPAAIDYPDYSIERTATHLHVRCRGKWAPAVEIPLAYVPLIIHDLTLKET